MADQSNQLSAESRIIDRSHDAVVVMQSRPETLRLEINWAIYISGESVAPRPAEPSAFRPVANFFKNKLLSEAKNPAVRISTGDYFAMEDVLTPSPRYLSGNFHRIPGGCVKPATAPIALPVIWAKDQTKHVRVSTTVTFGRQKITCAKIEKYMPVRICRLDHLGMTKDPKYRLPLPDPKYGKRSKTFFGQAEKKSAVRIFLRDGVVMTSDPRSLRAVMREMSQSSERSTLF